MPPVEDVPLFELPLGAREDVRPRQGRIHVLDRQNVLQLIPEPEGPTRLVVARAGQDPRGDCLVEQPAVQQEVQRRRRRAHARRAQQSVPVLAQVSPRGVEGLGLAPLADELTRVVRVAARTQHEQRLDLFPGADLQVHLECATRIESRSDPPRETPAREGRRGAEVPLTPHELGPVPRVAVGRAVGGEERDARGVVRIPRVAGEESARARGVFGDHEGPGGAGQLAEHPLRVVRRRDAARVRGRVAQPQSHELDRSVLGHEDAQPLLQAVAVLAPFRVAGAVTNLARRREPRRTRRRGPDLGRLFVPQVEALSGRIRDRVVAPRREAELAAVLGPRVAASALGHKAAEPGIRQHVAPGRRSALAWLEVNDVLPTVCREAAKRVVEQQILRPLEDGRRVSPGHRLGRRERRQGARLAVQLGKLLGQRTVGVEDRPGGDLEQAALVVGKLVATQEVDTLVAPQPLARAELVQDPVEPVARDVLVAGGHLREHDQVDADAAMPPEGVGPDQIRQQFRVVRIGAAHQQDGRVAGDCHPPESGLAEMVLRHPLGRTSQRGSGVQQEREQLLKLGQSVGRDAEAADLSPDVGMRVGEQPIERGQRVAARRRLQHGLWRAARDGHEGELLGGVGRELHAGLQSHDGVERDAGGAGEPGLEGAGRVGAAVAPQEALPVRLEADATHRWCVRHQPVEQGRWVAGRIAWSTRE